MHPKNKNKTESSGPSSSKVRQSYDPITARVDIRKSKFFEQNFVRSFERFRSGILDTKYFRRSADSCLTARLGQFRIFATHSSRLGRITAIKWHPTTQNLIAFGSKFGDVAVCNVNGIEDQATKFKPQFQKCETITDFCFNPFADDSLLVSSEDGNVTNWSYELCNICDSNTNAWYQCVNASKETGLIVAGDSVGQLHLFRKDMKRISGYTFHTAKVSTVEFNKKQNHIFVTASSDRTIKMWDVRMLGNGKGKSKFTTPLGEVTHDYAINAAHFSRTNSNRLLLTDQIMMLKVYAMPFLDLETTIYHPHRQFHLTPIKASWHPLADLIVAGRYPDPIIPNNKLNLRGVDIFDAKTGQNELFLEPAERNSTMSLNEFNCTGEYMASAEGMRVVFRKASSPQSENS